jgi:hypothetical protein
MIWLTLVYGAERHFQQYFSYIMAVSFFGEGNRNTLRKPPTCLMSLTNFVTIFMYVAIFCFVLIVHQVHVHAHLFRDISQTNLSVYSCNWKKKTSCWLFFLSWRKPKVPGKNRPTMVKID